MYLLLYSLLQWISYVRFDRRHPQFRPRCQKRLQLNHSLKLLSTVYFNSISFSVTYSSMVHLILLWVSEDCTVPSVWVLLNNDSKGCVTEDTNTCCLMLSHMCTPPSGIASCVRTIKERAWVTKLLSSSVTVEQCKSDSRFHIWPKAKYIRSPSGLIKAC
jgi:hypothetical protein